MKAVAVAAFAAILATFLSAAPPRVAWAGEVRPTHRVEKLVDDVYLIVPLEAGINSNAVAVVNQDDVVLVDSNNDPRAGRNLLATIKTITPKPVRYVVNTHYHFDHSGGNEVFAPTAEIIGSVFTRHMLTNNPLQGRTAQIFVGANGSEAQKLASLKARAAAEKDSAAKADLLRQAREVEESLASLAQEVVTPPTLVADDKFVLYRGGREIQIIFPGRGHTAGDLLVFLPKERVVVTGDFFLTGRACCGFTGDFYPADYVTSLDVLKALDFNIVVPGHGAPLVGDGGKKRVDAYQDYLTDFWNQTVAFKAQGLSALEASRKLDLTRHRANFPGTRAPAEFTGTEPDMAIMRAYELLDGKDIHGAAPY